MDIKVRTDFVTNSSSSSFVVLQAESKTLAEILNRFRDELEEQVIVVLNEISGDNVSLSAEDYVEPPEKLSEIVNAIAQLFCYEVYIPGFYEDEEEEQEAKEEFEEILEDDEYGISAIVAKEIIKNRKAIENDLKNFSGEFSDYSYGGDSDALYYRENYNKEYLEELLEKIAKENGCTPDEVDDDAFIRYVGRYIGEDKVTVNYSKENGEFSSSRNFTLNNL